MRKPRVKISRALVRLSQHLTFLDCMLRDEVPALLSIPYYLDHPKSLILPHRCDLLGPTPASWKLARVS